MTETQSQKRYIEKNNKVFDTWKNIPISRELDRYSLSHIISHLNGLGEIIDTQIEQGRYCIMKYNELKKENEQLKQEKDYFEKKKCEYWNKFNLTHLDNINLQNENKQLKQQLISILKLIEKIEDCTHDIKLIGDFK